MVIEENPFEDAEIAKQWINSVEGEKDGIRDLEIYPLLKSGSRRFGRKPFLISEQGRAFVLN